MNKPAPRKRQTRAQARQALMYFETMLRDRAVNVCGFNVSRASGMVEFDSGEYALRTEFTGRETVTITLELEHTTRPRSHNRQPIP